MCNGTVARVLNDGVSLMQKTLILLLQKNHDIAQSMYETPFQMLRNAPMLDRYIVNAWYQ
jgi:hypothetical protein